MRGGGQRHLLRSERLHRIEPLAVAFKEDAHEIDRDVRAPQGRVDRSGMPQVGLDRVNLSDPAERLQVPGEIGPADRDADFVVPLGQRPHDMAAEKARAAEHGDENVVVGLKGHASDPDAQPPPRLPFAPGLQDAPGAV